MQLETNPDVLAVHHGISVIGAAQRTIAFASIASGGTGLINITAAGHALKKNQCFNIVGGAYAGIHRVKKVVSANVIQVEFTFGATAAGNLLLLSHKEGYGFYVDSIPLTIASIDPEAAGQDSAAFILTQFIAGVYYPFPFKSIRITAGNITVVNQPLRSALAYSNR